MNWKGFKWTSHGLTYEVMIKSVNTGSWIFMSYKDGQLIGGGAIGSAILEHINQADGGKFLPMVESEEK